MDAVRLLHALRARRLAVAVGLLVAIVAGTAISYRVSLAPPRLESREYQVGVATVDVLVDSGLSQVADLGGGELRTDLASLGTRAQLLANLLAAGLLRERIAARAGIDPRRLRARVLAASTDAAPQKPAALDGPIGPRATTLTVSVRDLVPIITIDAQAPDPATAERIVTAATTELESFQQVVSPRHVPHARRLVIKTLGRTRAATSVHGPRRIHGLIASVLIFGLWCAAIVFNQPIARRWREAAHHEDDYGDPPRRVPEMPVGGGWEHVPAAAAEEIPVARRRRPATLEEAPRDHELVAVSDDRSRWASAPEWPGVGAGGRARRKTH